MTKKPLYLSLLAFAVVCAIVAPVMASSNESMQIAACVILGLAASMPLTMLLLWLLTRPRQQQDDIDAAHFQAEPVTEKNFPPCKSCGKAPDVVYRNFDGSGNNVSACKMCLHDGEFLAAMVQDAQGDNRCVSCGNDAGAGRYGKLPACFTCYTDGTLLAYLHQNGIE